MTTGWPSGPLPLLAALIAYSEPKAISARRDAERYASDDQLNRFADFVITTAAERGDTIISYPDFAARDVLTATREALVEPFRQAVQEERIFLRGTPPGIAPGSARELIPNGWAQELEIHFGDGSIRRLTDRWISVIATTIPPRAEELATCRRLVEAAEQAVVGYMPDGAYPLKQALLRLAAPELAREFTEVEAELTRFRQIVAGRRPKELQGVPLIGLDSVGRDLTEHRLLDRKRRAESAVTADFLARVQDERVILTGLQTHPQLAAGRVRLSPAWVPHMVFDWERQAVRVAEAVFVDVQGEARKPRAASKPRSVRPKAAASRGRPGFPFDRLVEIASSPSWQRANRNMREAEALVAEYRRRHPEEKPPAYSTVLSHVGRIYAAVAQAAATVKSRKSK